MDKRCFIVEDLLPLYNEHLLSEETTEWFEEHVAGCNRCKKLVSLDEKQLITPKIEPTVNDKEMFAKIHQKLSRYQMIFVSLSLVLAMATSILNESFQFILTYTILGAVTYVFYKNMWIVFSIAFIPVFLWFVGITTNEYINGQMVEGLEVGKFILTTLSGGAVTAFIHLFFALIGSAIGFLILKIAGGAGDEQAKSDL